jgi:hypothetical protein
METRSSSETPVTIYQFIWRPIPEDLIFTNTTLRNFKISAPNTGEWRYFETPMRRGEGNIKIDPREVWRGVRLITHPP